MAAEADNGEELIDPQALRVLVVDSTPSSRQNIVRLLQDCSYQVTGVRTSKEAVQIFEGEQGAFDLIIKDHNPPNVSACRLLRRVLASPNPALRQTPIIVVSSQDDRELVVKCLHLGAADYLIKPLRHNELRHVWRWVWMRRVLHSYPPPPAAALQPLVLSPGHPGPSRASSTTSEETQCDNDDEPTSKEGSAPDGNGEGNGSSRNHAKAANGSNGNGNSATKHASNGRGNGHGSSGNGNGASTTHHEGIGSVALMGTAEGGKVYTGTNGASGSGNDVSRGGTFESWNVPYAKQHISQGNGNSASGVANNGESRVAPYSDAHIAGGAAVNTYEDPEAKAADLSDHSGGSGNEDGIGLEDDNSGADNSNGNANGNSGSGNGNGNSGVGNDTRSGASPQPDAALQGTAEGKCTEVVGEEAAKAVGGAAGFRAWVSPGRSESGRKRASAELSAPPDQLPGRNAAGQTLTLRESLEIQRQGSVPEGPTNGSLSAHGSGGTGNSEDTHLGSRPGASPAGYTPLSNAGSLSAPLAQRMDSGQQQQHWAQPAAAMQLQRLPSHQQAQQHAQQQQAQQQQQQQQHPQMSPQLYPAGNGMFSPFGPMPPHMLQPPPNFVGMQAGHFSPWGNPGREGDGSSGGHPMAFAFPPHMLQAGSAAQQQATAQQQAREMGARQQQAELQMAGAMMYQPGYPGYMLPYMNNAAAANLAHYHNWRAGGHVPAWQANSQQQQQQQGHGQPQADTQAQSSQPPGTGIPHPTFSAPEPRGQHGHHRGPGGSQGGPAGLPPQPCMAHNGACSMGGNGERGTGGEPSRKERRMQALQKYKQKRKNLCFTKKIRYESRKQLAQARPRVKGQFVRVKGNCAEAATADEAALLAAGPKEAEDLPPEVLLEAAGQLDDTAPGLELLAGAQQALNHEGMESAEEDEAYDEEEDELEEEEDAPDGADAAVQAAEAEVALKAGSDEGEEDNVVSSNPPVNAPRTGSNPSRLHSSHSSYGGSAGPSQRSVGKTNSAGVGRSNSRQHSHKASAGHSRGREGRNGSDSGSNSPEDTLPDRSNAHS